MRRYLKHSLLFAAVAALAACTVGPDYLRPSAPMAPAFKEAAGWKLAQPKDARLGRGWWQLFNDPLLNSLEGEVAISNQNVVAAEAQYRQAKALVEAARAGLYPTVSVAPGATRSRRSASVGGSAAVSDYTLPVDFAWEADVWGRLRRSVEANRAGAQASEADLAAAELSAQTALAQEYFLLRSQDDQKRILDGTVASFQKALELTQSRYAGGVAARSDLLQAETQLKTANAQAIDLEVQRAQLEHAIALLVGKPASSFSIPVAPVSYLFPDIPAGLPSQLLERRPDIAGAERRMAAANAEIGVAQAAWYPDLRFSASAGLEAATLGKWISLPSRFWAIGGTFSETLFDGGLRSAQNEQARAAYDATVADYRQTVLTAFQEVEDNLSALRILEAEAKAQEEALSAARQTLAVVLNQYRAGIVSYLNVTVAQDTALTNERTAASIQARRQTASVLLMKALGGGWDSTRLK